MKLFKTLVPIVATSLIGAVGCSAAYPSLVAVSDSSEPTCLVGGRALLGPELTPKSAAVCFADGRIISADAQPLKNATRIDVSGNTIMPGLIDTHVHVTAGDAPPWHFRLPDPEHNLEAWLRVGITTVYDMGGVTEDIKEISKRVSAGEIPGPQIFYGHEPITAEGGHPIPAIKAFLPWPMSSTIASQVPTLSHVDEAPALVQKMKGRGAGHIKIIHDSIPRGAPRLSVLQLKALVDAAHAQALPAYVHVATNQNALEAIAAGADHLAHGIYTEAINTDVLNALVKNNVTVTYTAAGFDNTREMTAGRYAPTDESAAMSDPNIVEAVTGNNGKAFGEQAVLGEFARTIAARNILTDNIKRLHDAGVTILVGTDSPIAAVFPGGSYLEELHFLQEAGIPASVLARRATVDAAALKDGNSEFGVIRVGARADIIVIDGDPLNDIMVVQNLKIVIANGRRVTLR